MGKALLPKNSRALFVPINFRQAACTLKFLERISVLQQFEQCHVLIVDNNSGDDSVIRIREGTSDHKNIELAASSENRGYFGGARWGLDQYLAHHSIPDWVIVCNNDIEFHDCQFLEKLLQIDPTTVGMIAPAIVSGLTEYDANPSIQNRPTAFRMLQYRLWFCSYHAMWIKQWLWPFVRRARKRLQSAHMAPAIHTPTQIYAPHGSLLIFSRRFFESGGFLDDGGFLYSEEFLVAELCRHLGLPIVYDPALRVRHEEGQTLGRMLTRQMFQFQKDGFLYALARYNNSHRELDAPFSGMERLGVAHTNNAETSLSTSGDNVG